ncbi:MAG: FAD-dependent oxidoreductase, partial [Chloroflexi bacterium]|nr:FAD-dependent oxidoreductase [Chloroflexota bacterium]
MAHWNVEARVQALREQAERAGVHQVLGALVFGTVVNGNRVRGVVAATAYGPVALLGQVTLDATGDGDVAAWAGAEVVYGSAREHVVMWGYMPQIAAPDLPRNVKTSMVDTTNIYDMNRMIRAERRRAQPGDYDHGVYLAPRESRHVRGGVTLTLTDQLTRRCWPDVVYIAFSNYDMKGEATSDWVRMGIQPPNLTIEIPYRALVPNGLEDILV